MALVLYIKAYRPKTFEFEGLELYRITRVSRHLQQVQRVMQGLELYRITRLSNHLILLCTLNVTSLLLGYNQQKEDSENMDRFRLWLKKFTDKDIQCSHMCMFCRYYEACVRDLKGM